MDINLFLGCSRRHRVIRGTAWGAGMVESEGCRRTAGTRAPDGLGLASEDAGGRDGDPSVSQRAVSLGVLVYNRSEKGLKDFP